MNIPDDFVSDEDKKWLKILVRSRTCFGLLNIPDLSEDGLINMTKSEFTLTYIPCKLFGVEGMFVGQNENGVPNGFIIFVS